MRVLINLSNIKIGGGLQVACSLFDNLKYFSDKYEFVVVASSIVLDSVDKSEKNKFVIIEYDKVINIRSLLFGSDRFLSTLEIDFKPDVVFSLFGPSYWRPSVLHILGFAKAQYIYKDSPYFDSINTLDYLKIKLKEILHVRDFKKNGDVYITENPDISVRLAKIVNKPVYTVSNTYHQIFDNDQNWVEVILPEYDESNFNLITVARNYPHKNLRILISVSKRLIELNPNAKFMFYITENKDIFKNEEIPHNIKLIGPVPINKIPILYLKSDAMILPTLLESFSASYVEAFKMNRIVLTSKLGFARGICGDSALYFNPQSVDSICHTILLAYYDSALVKKCVVKGKNRLESFESPLSRVQKYLSIITHETANSKS